MLYFTLTQQNKKVISNSNNSIISDSKKKSVEDNKYHLKKTNEMNHLNVFKLRIYKQLISEWICALLWLISSIVSFYRCENITLDNKNWQISIYCFPSCMNSEHNIFYVRFKAPSFYIIWNHECGHCSLIFSGLQRISTPTLFSFIKKTGIYFKLN